MAKCFEQAHSRGDGASANQFINQGKEHQHKMESLNKQASDWIFASEWCLSWQLWAIAEYFCRERGKVNMLINLCTCLKLSLGQ